MNSSLVLQLETRTPGRKGLTHGLRRKGMVPAVLYGANGTAYSVAVSLPALQAALYHGAEHHPVSLQTGPDEKPQLAMIKGLQRDLLTGIPTHADFQPIQQDKPVAMAVPVRFLGEAELNAQGLLLHVHLREVPVEAKPTEVPDFIDVDVTHLHDGDSLPVVQLRVPTGVRLLEPAAHVVATVGHSRVHVEEEPTPTTAEMAGLQ